MTFRFKPVLTLSAFILMIFLIGLGLWQMQRLSWKQALIAQVETRIAQAPIPFEDAARRADAGEDMAYTPVAIRGRLQADKQARVFGAYKGAAGAFIFTPIQSEDGVVYVNRGFAPQSLVETECFCGASTLGEQTMTGYFRTTQALSPPASWFQSRGKSADGLWFVRNPVAFAAEAGISSSPYYIDEFANASRDWPKGGTTRLEFTNRHLEYALTWFALAATLASVWLAFSLQKQN